MSTVTIISPAEIKTGEAQKVEADLTKFDFAKSQVALVAQELASFAIITDAKTADDALGAAKVASEVAKAIEVKRTQLVKPFNDCSAQINAYVKDLVGPIAPAIQRVKDSVLQFQISEQKKAKQAMVTARQGQLAQLGFLFDSNLNRYVLEGIGMISSTEMESYDDNSWATIVGGFVNTISLRNADKVASLKEDGDMLEAFGEAADVAANNEAIQQLSTPVVAPAAVIAAPAFKAKGTTTRWVFEVTDPTVVPREYLQVNETLIRKAVADGIRSIPGVNIKQDTSIALR